jgi:hypothetical protein
MTTPMMMTMAVVVLEAPAKSLETLVRVAPANQMSVYHAERRARSYFSQACWKGAQHPQSGTGRTPRHYAGLVPDLLIHFPPRPRARGHYWLSESTRRGRCFFRRGRAALSSR